MAGKSNYFENAVLNTLRNVSLAVANVYVALFTTLPATFVPVAAQSHLWMGSQKSSEEVDK